MCGRYQVDTEEDILELRQIIDEINRRFQDSPGHAAMKTGEIFPTDCAPVLAGDGPRIMRWGLPMQGKSGAIINARAETAGERPMFKTALRERRVAVPATGFYEWTHGGGKGKDKYLFRVSGQRLIYLAGLYTLFHLPQGEEMRYAILTTGANESLAPYHHRMPVYVSAREARAWTQDWAMAQEVLSRPQPQYQAAPVAGNRQLSMF